MNALLLATAVLCGLAAQALAEPLPPDDPAPAPDAAADSFWTRDTLTGDWGGLRTRLAENGLTTEFSFTGYFADVLSGGGTRDDLDFGGRADAFFHLDIGKMGLWGGGGLHVHVESRFGEATDRPAPRSGGIWPINTGTVLPLGDPERVVASSIYYTQALGEETIDPANAAFDDAVIGSLRTTIFF